LHITFCRYTLWALIEGGEITCMCCYRLPFSRI
jgi:hypothetical protein